MTETAETTEETVPELKQALQAAAANRTDEGFLQDDVTTVLNAFLNSTVYAASSEEPDNDKGANLLVVQDGDGKPLPVLFSSQEEAEQHKEQAPFVVQTNGITLVRTLDVGVVLDPMAEHQFLIPAEQMAQMRSFVEEQLAEAEAAQD
ncbi:SseB family protein [Nesterenkonia alkaliphila]|uniref:SseB protein N-terminal domain-containing protein n=1 Tax=Nesterenkonia alkaliphila TaxID=1463631 RepID=A0A7K1UME4_9MICC|nr:SseB family protein [Nesterenkonia alkaliphila]MVT27472.1 hypothetical protein [Nesterenkonia alkaliphila]GFZ89412.1 hypothetical protein GCM10011359_18490 [Nesterenkonia alkaliphila]